MRDPIKGFDDVQEYNGELLAFTEAAVHVPEKSVDVVKGGELFSESGLVVGEKVVTVEERDEAVVDHSLEKPHDDAGDADQPVGRRV